ncbi:MAG: mammalian cell entry protein [Rhodospirillales bacterium 20-60-12]|nr:MAG: mammalian cell entry protein [Rhodospirillales bacterium 20-60-12]HQT67721.1 MlaD family protein [Acetobacteraceae bacterium]
MENKAAGFRVGLFVLGGLVALLAIIFVLSGSAFQKGLSFETYFAESVQGLDVGTAVKFHGVSIGKITDIGLASAEYRPDNGNDLSQKAYRDIVVRFTIDPKKLGRALDVQDAVKQGLRVQIAPQGITGLAYLELTFINNASAPLSVPWTPKTDVIPSVPSTLTQVQDAIQSFMSQMAHVNLADTVTSLTSLIKGLNQEITTGDAHQTLSRANQLLAALQDQIQQADLPATTKSIRTLADGAQTRQLIANLDRTTAQLAKVTAQMQPLIVSLQATASKADTTTADLNAQMIPILHDLHAASSNLRDVSETLEHNPGSILSGAPPPHATPRGDAAP